MTYVIETVDLVKKFKKQKSFKDVILHPFKTELFTALNKVNFQVKYGEVFGLLGPNGAGKSTLIKILCTIVLPTSGEAFVNGYNVATHGEEVRRAFGYVISEERSFHWRLSARQNLNFYSALNNLFGKERDQKVEEVLQVVGLDDRADVPFSTFSTGMRQRLAIARSLLTNPDVLFMDEPTRSLDPPAAQALRKFVKEKLVDEQGKTVFLATHIMEEAEYLCDRLAVLNHGQILVSGTVPEVRQAVNRRQVYTLGLHYAPEGLIPKLNQLNGVMSIQAIPAPLMRNESYFRIEVQDNGHAVMPDLVNAVVHAGGQIATCAPYEEPLGEVLARVLEGGKRS